MEGYTQTNENEKNTILTGPFKGYVITRLKVHLYRASDGKTVIKGDWNNEEASKMHSYIGRNWERILSDGELI
jgi:hypothetical protein